MSFVLLILALLGGGLICLLVINTTLGATSFQITQLQSTNASLSEQDQVLQQAIANSEAPGQIARRAYALGMRWQSQLNYLNPVTGRIYQAGSRGPGTVDPFVSASTANSGHGATSAGAKHTRTSKSGRTAHGPGRARSGGKTRPGTRRRGTSRPRTQPTAGSAR